MSPVAGLPIGVIEVMKTFQEGLAGKAITFLVDIEPVMAGQVTEVVARSARACRQSRVAVRVISVVKALGTGPRVAQQTRTCWPRMRRTVAGARGYPTPEAVTPRRPCIGLRLRPKIRRGMPAMIGSLGDDPARSVTVMARCGRGRAGIGDGRVAGRSTRSVRSRDRLFRLGDQGGGWTRLVWIVGNVGWSALSAGFRPRRTPSATADSLRETPPSARDLRRRTEFRASNAPVARRRRETAFVARRPRANGSAFSAVKRYASRLSRRRHGREALRRRNGRLCSSRSTPASRSRPRATGFDLVQGNGPVAGVAYRSQCLSRPARDVDTAEDPFKSSSHRRVTPFVRPGSEDDAHELRQIPPLYDSHVPSGTT